MPIQPNKTSLRDTGSIYSIHSITEEITNHIIAAEKRGANPKYIETVRKWVDGLDNAYNALKNFDMFDDMVKINNDISKLRSATEIDGVVIYLPLKDGDRYALLDYRVEL